MRKVFWLVLALFAATGLLLTVYPIFSVNSSPASLFNVTPDTVFINWTNSYAPNISIGVNTAITFDNVTFEVLNSSVLVANYSQSNSATPCLSGYTLLVKNVTNENFTTTLYPALNSSNITTATLVETSHLSNCAPGRYWNNTFTINATNTTGTNIENANITVVVDIPISPTNTLLNGTGTFNGSLPVNATTFQSFYFNTSFDNSVFSNSTAISINLATNSSQVAQIFLFDNSSVMKAKSINLNSSQYLSYYPLPSSQMWEIRVYGNSISAIPYNGTIIYSTLNVTNSPNSNLQLVNISSGKLNVSQSVTTNMTLINQGTLALSNVALTDNIFRIQKFSGSSSQNFPFLVGDSNIESKIRVGLHWTGSSNYTLNVYDPNGNLVMTSSNYYTLAKAAGGTSQELYNETTSIVPGYWNISVVSNSGSDNFNLNVTTFEKNLQNWIATNYSTTSFNGVNSNTTIQFNLTIPNTTVDGAYQGNLYFTDAKGGQVAIPFYFNVTTPTLLVLNATNSPTLWNPFNFITSQTENTFRQDENNGAGLTKVINFNLSNVGSFDQVINATLNSTNLTCSGCAYQANMTSNITSITYLPSGSSKLFQVNITYNSSFPLNTYYGWIFINATNDTSFVLNSHPYSSYNLSIELNLTDSLNVKAGLLEAANGTNFVNSGDVYAMQAMNVYYINGTEITTLGPSNFTKVWLQEKNVSTISAALGTIPSSGSLTVSNATGSTTTLYCTSSCGNFVTSAYDLNLTLPTTLPPGGQYAVYSSAGFNRSDGNNFQGQGINSSTLIVANTGLFMSSNDSCNFDSTCSSSPNVNPNGTYVITAKVSNYGPVAATAATINLTTACTGYAIASAGNQGCASTPTYAAGTDQWTVNVPAYSTNCYVSWLLTATSSSSGAPSCDAAHLMGAGGTWFDPSGVNISLTVNAVNTTSNNNNNANNNVNLPGSSPGVYVSITNYPTIIYIVQNSTNSSSVTVKNVNNSLTQDIDLAITGLNSSWYTISPTIRTAIAPFDSVNFTLTFNVPQDAAVQDYIATLAASTNYGNASQSFTLRVLPSAQTKISINETYQLYLLNYTELSAQVNSTKASGMNTTQVEGDLSLAKVQLDQAQNYITAGDYFSAQQSLNQAKALLEAATTDFKNLTAKENPLANILGSLQGNLLYLAVGGVAIAAVFIAYLFWPTKSTENPLADIKKFKAKPSPTIKSSPSTGETNWDKLKNKWSWESLKNKWKNK